MTAGMAAQYVPTNGMAANMAAIAESKKLSVNIEAWVNFTSDTTTSMYDDIFVGILQILTINAKKNLIHCKSFIV